MMLTINDVISGDIVSFVVKRIVNYGDQITEYIVSVKVGEPIQAEAEAKELVRLLDESSTSEMEYYEYEAYTNGITNIGNKHSNEIFKG